MTTLKAKEITKMSKEEMEKKMKELALELVKSRAGASKAGTSKIKETKKIMARILTLNKSSKEALKNQ